MSTALALNDVRVTQRFFWTLSALVVAALLWLAIAPLDIVSDAPGEVVPSTQLKEIQHLEGGIIEEIVVREGERVAMGQALLVLQATASEADVRELETRITHARENLVLIEEQIGISEELLRDELTNRYNHLTLLREANTLRSRLAEDEHKILKLKDNLDRTVLKSPVAGFIKRVLVDTQGGVVKAGETVIEIVPADDRLVVEAQLPFFDVGYVHAGQKAQVRLASADAARFQALEGDVVQVSPDSIVPDEGDPYYLVRVETDADAFVREEERYPLIPGMQMQVSILTGQRSVLEYLLTPFLSSAGKAMRER
jgi:adhesin transport system membrane fusion protein